VDHDKKVDGEAFNIHDGESHLFWGYARTVWRLAGHKPNNERLISVPAGLVLGLASFLEWIFWIFSLGTKRPYHLGKQQVEYACFTHTYSIEKAKKRPGFNPVQTFEKTLNEAVTWSMENGGWGKKFEKVTA
jgi:sterol-4alpha-carboxylate 3-dehydrogenase (decarboxylating)